MIIETKNRHLVRTTGFLKNIWTLAVLGFERTGNGQTFLHLTLDAIGKFLTSIYRASFFRTSLYDINLQIMQ
jgi:hypothetical protein